MVPDILGSPRISTISVTGSFVSVCKAVGTAYTAPFLDCLARPDLALFIRGTDRVQSAATQPRRARTGE
jgi:hypothetical protein